MSYRQPEYPHAELGSFRLASFNAGTLDCIVPYQPDLAQLHGHIVNEARAVRDLLARSASTDQQPIATVAEPVSAAK